MIKRISILSESISLSPGNHASPPRRQYIHVAPHPVRLLLECPYRAGDDATRANASPPSCPADGSAAGGLLEDAVTTDFSELCETKSCASRARRLDGAPAHQPRREGYVRLPRLQGFASGLVLLGVSCKVWKSRGCARVPLA